MFEYLVAIERAIYYLVRREGIAIDDAYVVLFDAVGAAHAEERNRRYLATL